MSTWKECKNVLMARVEFKEKTETKQNKRFPSKFIQQGLSRPGFGAFGLWIPSSTLSI